MLLSSESVHDSIVLGLDTMAGENIFHDSTLFNKVKRVKRIEIQSANSGKSVVDRGGYSKFGEALYWRDVPVNLISFGELRDFGCWIEYDGVRDEFIISHSNFSDLIFVRGYDNLYMCEVRVDKRGEIIMNKGNNNKVLSNNNLQSFILYVTNNRYDEKYATRSGKYNAYKKKSKSYSKMYDHDEVMNDVEKCIAESRRTVGDVLENNISHSHVNYSKVNKVDTKAYMFSVKDKMAKYSKLK